MIPQMRASSNDFQASFVYAQHFNYHIDRKNGSHNAALARGVTAALHNSALEWDLRGRVLHIA
jgi:hypothetical protein